MEKTIDVQCNGSKISLRCCQRVYDFWHKRVPDYYKTIVKHLDRQLFIVKLYKFHKIEIIIQYTDETGKVCVADSGNIAKCIGVRTLNQIWYSLGKIKEKQKYEVIFYLLTGKGTENCDQFTQTEAKGWTLPVKNDIKSVRRKQKPHVIEEESRVKRIKIEKQDDPDDDQLSISESILDNPEKYLRIGTKTDCQDKKIFDLVKPDVIKNVQEKKKLMKFQLFIDFKFCKRHDDYGRLPIHNAAIENDLNVLKRHCAVLKTLDQNVDIRDGESDSLMTPLHYAVKHENKDSVKVLLLSGANPFEIDSSSKNAFHYAADKESFQIIFDHLRDEYKQKIIGNVNTANFEESTTVKINSAYDDEGLNPLMWASKKGHIKNILFIVNKLQPAMKYAVLTETRRGSDETIADMIQGSDMSIPMKAFFQRFKKSLTVTDNHNLVPENEVFSQLNSKSSIINKNMKIINSVPEEKEVRILPKKSKTVKADDMRSFQTLRNDRGEVIGVKRILKFAKTPH